MTDLSIFFISFFAPLLFWRIFFAFNSKYFERPLIRTKSGLQIHHLHHGIFYMAIATVLILTDQYRALSIVLLGIGLGSMIDDLIADIKLPGNRSLELELYRKSLSNTILLFILISAMIMAVYYLL